MTKPVIVSAVSDARLEQLKLILNKKWSLDGAKIPYTDSVFNTFRATRILNAE
jgi:hypothetical protein